MFKVYATEELLIWGLVYAPVLMCSVLKGSLLDSFSIVPVVRKLRIYRGEGEK